MNQMQDFRFLDNLTAAAKENPLAAALIGGGALWFLMGNRSIKGAAGAIADATTPLADMSARQIRTGAEQLRNVSRAAGNTAGDVSRAASDMAGDLGNMANETSRSITGGISDGAKRAASASADIMSDGLNSVSETLGSVRHSISDGVDRARDSLNAIPNPAPALKAAYGQAQSTLSDILERQPLVLGAIGLAVGAAVAGAVPNTSLENTYAGPLSDEIKDDIKTRARTAISGAKDAGEDLMADASGAAGQTLDRLKQVGQNAAQAARDTASEKVGSRKPNLGVVHEQKI